MTRILRISWLLLALMLFSRSLAHGQSQPALWWAGGTSLTMAPGMIETGLLHPLRWGISDRVELSSRPLMGILGPNGQVKLSWGLYDDWHVASRHGLSYPSPFLRMISREGIGGMLPVTDLIPTINATSHELLATRSLGTDHLLTLRVGIRAALSVGEEEMTTIDLPIIYHRMTAYYGRPVLQTGMALAGGLLQRLTYQVDGDFLLTTTDENHYAIEHSGLLGWELSRRWSLNGGYKLISGLYPFGSQVHLLPVIDVRWQIR